MTDTTKSIIEQIRQKYVKAFPKDFYLWSEMGFWLREIADLEQSIRQSERDKLAQLVSDCNPDQGQPELNSCYNEWSGELLEELRSLHPKKEEK